jgi:hypothetical protein
VASQLGQESAPATLEEALDADEVLSADGEAPRLHRLESLAMQMGQLLTHVAKPKATADPFGILGRGLGSEPPSESTTATTGAGVRGFARRREWKDLLKSPPAARAIQARISSGVAQSLNIDSAELRPTDMARYFTEIVPLSGQPLLTHVAMIAAEQWRAIQAGDQDRLALLASLLCLFCDQTARDGGNTGMGYLYTGLPEPNWHAIRGRTQGAWTESFSPLADERWLAAHVEYLRDLDYLEQRRHQIGKAKSKAENKSGSEGKGKEKAKGGPKQSPKGGKADPKA